MKNKKTLVIAGIIIAIMVTAVILSGLLGQSVDPTNPGGTTAPTVQTTAPTQPGPTDATNPTGSTGSTEPAPTQPTPTEPTGSTGTTEPPHAHTYAEEVVAPTCLEGGYTVFTCQCGDTYTGAETEATGHAWGEWETLQAATEEAEGLKERKCSACGETESEDIPKLEASHTHGYTAQIVSPTCTDQGYTVYTCSCGDSYKQDYVDALGHGYVKEVTAATCTADGYTTYTCTACGDVYEADPVAATGHSYGAWQTKTAATCTTSGEEKRTCTACGNAETRTAAVLGHAYDQWTRILEPGCETEGQDQRLCSRCGGKETRSVSATGHNYKTSTKAPTCTEQGSVTKTCANCGKVVAETTEALGHTYGDWIPASEANCTQGGEEYRTCSVCNELETRTVPAGHSWGDWVLTKPATWTVDGERERTCKACGATETETIGVNDGHTHNWVETVVEPTCEQAGYIWLTCSVCGDAYEKPGSYIPSDNGSNSEGHGWSDWVVTKEPTTTAPGTQERTCTYCGEIQVVAIPQLNEDGSEYESYIDPAVTVEEGYTGMKYSYDKIIIRDHRSWGDAPSIWVNEDGSVTIVYFNLEGERIEIVVEQPEEGFVRGVYLEEDGTYYINTVGKPG